MFKIMTIALQLATGQAMATIGPDSYDTYQTCVAAAATNLLPFEGRQGMDGTVFLSGCVQDTSGPELRGA